MPSLRKNTLFLSDFGYLVAGLLALVPCQISMVFLKGIRDDIGTFKERKISTSSTFPPWDLAFLLSLLLTLSVLLSERKFGGYGFTRTYEPECEVKYLKTFAIFSVFLGT